MILLPALKLQSNKDSGAMKTTNGSKGRFALMGYDAFSDEEYPKPPRYKTERAAERAAQRELRRLERVQPSAESGGQHGIQDQVFVIHPDGTKRRILPDIRPIENTRCGTSLRK